MTDVIAGALIGVGGTAALMILGAVANSLRHSGQNKERLDTHQKRLDDHQELFDDMPVKYVPRTELAGQLEQMSKSQERTEGWVKFLVQKKAIHPESE